MNRRVMWAHVGLLISMILTGLMPPLSKDAMNGGVTPLQMAAFRICGAALLFWLVSIVVPSQKVTRRDMLTIMVASIFAIVMAQGGLMVGLGLTSPINASIEITTQPIVALLLAALLLGQPITWRKGMGVLLGFAGAVILVTLHTARTGREASFAGDLVVLGSQTAFALYLTLFSGVIKRYSLFTFNKWMFTFGALFILPFSMGDLSMIASQTFTLRQVAEVTYVVVGCTFMTFILVVNSQRSLPSTTVSTYNYVQPFVTVAASLAMGLAVFRWEHALAAALIFAGVGMVVRGTRSI